MKKELKSEIENNEEVKKIKSKYKKISRIFLIAIIMILIVLTIKILYDFNICVKTINANNTSNLGNNYKITRISYANDITYTYRKDDIFQNIHPNGTALVIVGEKAYMFELEKKEYQELDWNLSNPLNTSEYEMSKKDIFVNYILNGAKIGKEEYKGKQYITIRVDTHKVWVNPDTYYIEKELLSGQVEEKTIEKNVVKDEDILFYNLDEYTKIEN